MNIKAVSDISKISSISKLALVVGGLTIAPVSAVWAQQGGLEEIIITATKRSESLQEVPLAVSALSSEKLQKGGVFETSDLNRVAPNLQVSSPYGTQQPNFSIRGVGVGTEYNANAASPVGVYVDEVYQTFRASHGQQLYDLEQIEIVRGPQGTLYGRNTTGGAINFNTRKPELEGTNGNIAIGVGNYARRSVDGAIEFTPVEGSVGVRLAGTYVESDPFVDNVLPAGPSTASAFGASGLNFNSGVQPGGHENYGFRGTIRFQPSDTVDLMVKAYTAESDGGTEVPIPTGSDKNSDYIDYTNPNFLLGPLFSQLSDFGLLPTGYSQSGNGLGVRDIESDSAGRALTKSEGIVFTANVDLSDSLQFIAVTGYDSGDYEQLPTTDCDAGPLAMCTIGYDSEFDAYSIDMRLDYQSGPFKMIVGGFYGEDSLTSDNRPNFFNFLRDVNAVLGSAPDYFNPGGGFSGVLFAPDALPTGINADQHFKQERESWAIYSEANYELTETVNLTLGLRYSDDTLKFKEGYTTYYDDTGAARMLSVSGFNAGGVYQPYFLADVYDAAGNFVAPASVLNGGAPYPGPLEQDGGSDSVSGRFIVDWHVTDDVMLYASYSRGYRAGTINGLAYGSGNQVYYVEPEEVDAFEVGFKSRFMDDRVQLNGTAFFYDYSEQQGQIVDNTATAQLISLNGEVTGIELDAQFAATDTLILTAALGVLDTEYDDGACPEVITGFRPQAGNCLVSSGGPVNVGGNPFPYAAEITFNAGMDWQIAEIDNGFVDLHVDANYTGQYYYDAFEDYSKGILTNVTTGKFADGEGKYWIYNARLSYTAESYAVSLWGKNLADKEYYPFGISIENLFANGYRIIAPPRTFGVEFKYMF